MNLKNISDMTSKEKPSYYAIIPADVRYAPITPNAKLLYGEITALCSKEGYCWAGNAYFSTLYKSTPRTIKRWVMELETLGVIKVARRANQRAIVIVDRVTKMTPTWVKNVTLEGDKNVPHSITSVVLQNSTAAAAPTASLKELSNGRAAEPMNCPEFYTWTKISKQKHITIIGEWADTVKPDLRTRAQWSAFIKRNLRAARMLEAFTPDQLSSGFEKIEAANEKGWLKKYTLETLLKFIV